MRKIGGVSMNTITRLTHRTKDKQTKRYCTVYESLRQSLKEVKLHRQGKIKLNTWDEFLEELKKEE